MCVNMSTHEQTVGDGSRATIAPVGAQESRRAVGGDALVASVLGSRASQKVYDVTTAFALGEPGIWTSSFDEFVEVVVEMSNPEAGEDWVIDTGGHSIRIISVGDTE